MSVDSLFLAIVIAGEVIALGFLVRRYQKDARHDAEALERTRKRLERE